MTEKKLPVCSWENVKNYREKLKDCDNYPILAAFEHSWELLSDDYQVVDRDDRLERTAKSPLAAFFYFVNLGFYPPPEILLAMNDAFIEYENAYGNLELEDVFFGPSKRKAGNYSSRRAMRIHKMLIQVRFKELISDGVSRTEAAENISELLGGKPEPESILRMVRNINAT